MAMVRKQLYLPAGLDKSLAAEARRRGISQAELIRMRLEGRDTSARRARTAAEERRRQEALRALKRIHDQATEGPGTGRTLRREELYAERLNRIGPR
jgi:hypothetical protein